jgi:hypothetical protein
MGRVKDMVIDAHNAGYGDATVDELFEVLFAKDKWDEEVPVLKSALRTAVVREASVGTCHASPSKWKGVPTILKSIDRVEEGDYDLIPHKETP